MGGFASWKKPSSPIATKWLGSIDLIYALIVCAHVLIVEPVVSQLAEGVPLDPAQRGSLARRLVVPAVRLGRAALDPVQRGRVRQRCLTP